MYAVSFPRLLRTPLLFLKDKLKMRQLITWEEIFINLGIVIIRWNKCKVIIFTERVDSAWCLLSSCLLSSRLLPLKDKQQIREDNSQYLCCLCFYLWCCLVTGLHYSYCHMFSRGGDINSNINSGFLCMSLLLLTVVFGRGDCTTNTFRLIVKDYLPVC